MGLNSKSIIITTSNYSKLGLQPLFKKNKIYPVYQSSENFFNQQLMKMVKIYSTCWNIWKRKNLLTLIKAFKKLKEQLKVDYKLVLAGSTYINGDNKVLLKIEKYITEHNLFSSILMPGYIDKNLKALYFYNNSLMYVFPSVDEGFGIPLIEAFKLKVPVICSNIPIFREIAEDSVLYFEIQNEIDLFERMKELINSDQLSSKLVSKRLKVVKKFNRHNFIKDFEKIY